MLGRARRHARRAERAAQAARALWFPVDISTGSRATIGGMAGNNCCGARSIRYGNMVHNVRAIDAMLADGTDARISARCPEDLDDDVEPAALSRPDRATCARIVDRARGRRDRGRLPRLLRRVGGYNIDMIRRIDPGLNRNEPGHNMAQAAGRLGGHARLLHARSSSTCSRSRRAKVLGICHFPTFYKAMDATRHIVKLDPARGRAGRPHDDRAGARHPDVPPDRRPLRAAASPTPSCWSSSPARICRRQTAQARRSWSS